MSLTKTDAEAIAKKLKAKIYKSRPNHERALIWYRGKLVTQFGIRRGSRKDLGHGHIKQKLFVAQRKVKDLARCPMSREDWIKEMKDKGVIED